jgi:chorismate mutase
MSADEQRSLAELRARIDVLDDAIVSALSERFSLALKVGAHKGVEVQDEAREAEVLARVERLATELRGDRDAIGSTYALIVELSRQIQRTQPTPPIR